MTPQQIEAMKMALDLATMHHTDDGYAALRAKVRSASKEALAQPEQEEKLPPVEIGVDVTDIGTTVVAFYRRPNAVMEMFYSQFHPLAQPEQEPVAIVAVDGVGQIQVGWITKPQHNDKLYTSPPQRKPLTDEEIEDLYFDKFSMSELKAFARAIEAAHGIKE